VKVTRWRLAVRVTATVLFASAPALGDVTKDQCIDANGKAQELRRSGKLSAAREQLRTCGNPSCPAIVRDDCARRLDELEKVQPTVVFEAKDAAGRDLTAVKVTVDGSLLAGSLDGTALAVDPGAHTFTFEVAGQPPVTQQFVMHEGESGRSERVVIGAGVSNVSPATLPASPSNGSEEPSVHAPQASSPGAGTTKRIIGFSTGGVGIALLGLGTYYEAIAFSRDHDSDTAAKSPNPNVRATTSGIYNQAVQAQTYAYVLGGIGLAAVAAGVVIVLTSERASENLPAISVAPTVRPGVGAIDISGTW